MAFSFEKFVQKSTRGLFAFIVVIMIVPLVLWGYMGNQQEREEDKGDAGVIHGIIKISKGEYNLHKQTAPASWWWKKFNDPMTMMLMRYGRQPEPPKEEDIARQAWEDIILMREAKANGIEASEQEVLLERRDLFQKFTGGRMEYTDDTMGRIAGELFHVPFATFNRWLEHHVVMEKLLTLVGNSEFADFDKVYDRLMTGQQMAKVWYASFDPKDYLKELKAPTTDEIAGYYQKNKDKFKVPAKVQVAYLMADVDEMKKAEPEPTEEEIKNYYTANPVEFQKPHEHQPGEQHKEDEKPEVKPLSEVKGEIPNKIKTRAAEKKAAEIMARVDVALGAAATANNGNYPDDVFDQLKAKFKDDKLVYDITTSFDAKQVEDIEKIVGANSTLASWAFDPSLKVGSVSQKIKTGKGVALFRLQKKIDALDPGITERTRETIVKELQKEQIRKKTSQVANNVVQEITTNGMISARVKYPIDWRLTRYFKVGGDTGIEDAALGQAISQQVQGHQVRPGKASVLSGAMLRNKDKADWSYVVYLEDLADVPPEDVSNQFNGSRRGLDEEARRRYRDIFIQETVKSANVTVDPSMKKTETKSTDSAPKP
jgi:hypothetical protein